MPRRLSDDELMGDPYLLLNENVRVVSSVSLKAKYYVVLKRLSQKSGITMSEIVNMALEAFFDNCEGACDILDKLLNKVNEE